MGFYRDEQGNRVRGRVTVDECPEGLARLSPVALDRIALAGRFGLPGPWLGQDHRFLQALMAVGRSDV